MTPATCHDRAWIATRKGLIELRHRSGAWQIEQTAFQGEPVTMLLPPDREGRMLAALNLGHFGVKVHASADAGASWSEVATPTDPSQPKEDTGVPWKLQLIWSLEATGDSIRAGTIPGGLFRSDDFGASWQLVEGLWQRPERAEWMGAAATRPASIRSARTRSSWQAVSANLPPIYAVRFG